MNTDTFLSLPFCALRPAYSRIRPSTMAVGIPVMVPPHSSPSVTTTGAAEPTRAGSDSSTHEPTAATRVATILCTVIPVLVVLGMLVAGAFWIRHRSSARKRRGRVGSTITIEGDDGDEEEGGEQCLGGRSRDSRPLEPL